MKKRMLITGATSGIGTYLSHHFANEGYELYLHGRNGKKLTRLARALRPAKVTILEADMASLSSLAKMFQELKERTRSLNVVINNAFGKLECPLVKAKPADLSQFFQISLVGTAEVIRRSVPFLRNARPANVINIVADWGFPMHNILTGPSPYIAAKYGIHGLGAALQTEIASLGIRTTNICPGVVAAEAAYTRRSVITHTDRKAIHPSALAEAIDFVLAQNSAHVRSIVLSPTDPKYIGL